MSRPVFVVGAGRSGTTAVLELTAGCPESEGIPRLSGAFPRSSRLIGAWQRSLVPLPARAGSPSSECIGWLREAGFRPDRIDAQLVPQELDDYRTEVDRLRSRLLPWTTKSRAKVTLLKSTSSIIRVSALAEGIPEALFLHVVRHPVAVANSLARVGFFPAMPLWWAQQQTPLALVRGDSRKLPAVGVVHWYHQLSAGLSALEALSPDRKFEFRYEQPDPAGLAEFLDLDRASLEAQFANFRSASSVVESPTLNDIASVFDPAPIRQLAESLGYSLDGSSGSITGRGFPLPSSRKEHG